MDGLMSASLPFAAAAAAADVAAAAGEQGVAAIAFGVESLRGWKSWDE